MNNAPDDETHATLGRRFRTPAHPDVLAALGRALFCFLSLDIADALDAAVAAFRKARQSIRNELLHAHSFTACTDSDGRYLPGLAYTAKDGQSWKTISRSPQDLLDLAAAMEDALDPLNAARRLVQCTPLSAI